jgi:hypothetical protein
MYNGYRVLPGVKCGGGVLLTTHPLLAPRSWKSIAITLAPLWVTTGPVTRLLYLYPLSLHMQQRLRRKGAGATQIYQAQRGESGGLLSKKVWEHCAKHLILRTIINLVTEGRYFVYVSKDGNDMHFSCTNKWSRYTAKYRLTAACYH